MNLIWLRLKSPAAHQRRPLVSHSISFQCSHANGPDSPKMVSFTNICSGHPATAVVLMTVPSLPILIQRMSHQSWYSKLVSSTFPRLGTMNYDYRSARLVSQFQCVNSTKRKADRTTSSRIVISSNPLDLSIHFSNIMISLTFWLRASWKLISVQHPCFRNFIFYTVLSYCLFLFDVKAVMQPFLFYRYQ